MYYLYRCVSGCNIYFFYHFLLHTMRTPNTVKLWDNLTTAKKFKVEDDTVLHWHCVERCIQEEELMIESHSLSWIFWLLADSPPSGFYVKQTTFRFKFKNKTVVFQKACMLFFSAILFSHIIYPSKPCSSDDPSFKHYYHQQ